MVLILLLVFVFQVCAYESLGARLYRSQRMSIVQGAAYATALSLPVPAVAAYGIGLWSLNWVEALYVAGGLFAYLWVCFMCGATMQLWLISRYDRRR